MTYNVFGGTLIVAQSISQPYKNLCMCVCVLEERQEDYVSALEHYKLALESLIKLLHGINSVCAALLVLHVAVHHTMNRYL